LVVLEAEAKLAAHQTGNNSGVIHSGLYYKPGSLKARNCVEGREELYKFCQEYGILHDRCGKIVVATNEAELPMLDVLLTRGRENGLKGVRRLEAEELKDFEPHVAGVGGLHVPETGIVDFPHVTETFARLATEAGATVRKEAAFLKCHRRGDELVLETTAGEIHCRHLIACAGLHADRVAKLCDVEPGVKIIPFRGEYYELIPERTSLVKNLIYPVPDPRFPFLGVHFTRMAKGGVEAGPNAVLGLARHGYSWRHFSLRDSLEWASYIGFWRFAARHWRTGINEVYRSFSKRAFVTALQKLIPEVQMVDLAFAGAGVRAQALKPDGKIFDDFHIVPADRMIHVLNAPSPAATACISIGRTIAQMALDNWKL
jgi:L-2-hydroxyglutarate oxidase